MKALRIPFAGATLNRREVERRDASFVQQLITSDMARLLVVSDLALHRLKSDGDTSVDVPLRVALHTCRDIADIYFLGTETNSVPYFATHRSNVSAIPDEEFSDIDLRQQYATLADATLARLAIGRSLVTWHNTARFCGSCGQSARVVEFGAARKCTSCGTSNYPRVNPVALTLVLDGCGSCLLAQHVQRPKFFTCVAGFISQGETLEEAARREVEEETGLKVGNVSYVFSQPWPFPGQLMLGCFATVVDRNAPVKVDTHELLAAKWFTRDEVIGALARSRDSPLRVPDSIALANRLLSHWIDAITDGKQPKL